MLLPREGGGCLWGAWQVSVKGPATKGEKSSKSLLAQAVAQHDEVGTLSFPPTAFSLSGSMGSEL